jgi:predicted RNA-binding protein with PUA-like domain
VAREAYRDPTATEGDWSCVALVPVKPLKKPVGLETIKADKALKAIPLLKNSRLSVMPLTREQFERVLRLGEETAKPV